jgi:hypothetical protein
MLIGLRTQGSAAISKEVRMNRIKVSFLTAVLFSAACVAQNSAETPAAASAAPKVSVAVPPGTTVLVELTKPIDAHKAKPGDEVVAKVTEDIKSDNKVVLPKGSKVMGKVTQAQGRAKGQDESVLGLAFDSAVLKDGTQVPISFTIQAIANSSAAMAQAALEAQGASTSISMANNAPGGGAAGRPGLGSQAQGAAGADLHAGNAASTIHEEALTPASQGAIGLPGFTLSSGNLITSKDHNVRLERETRFVLRVNGQ